MIKTKRLTVERSTLTSRSHSLLVCALGTLLLALILTGASPLVQGASTSTTTNQTTNSRAITLNIYSDLSGATVTITKGSGFLPNSNITVKFDNATLRLSGTCTTDTSGALSECIFKIPPSNPGSHQIEVGDGSKSIATAVFTIPSIAPPESTFLVTLTAVGLTLVTQLVTRKVVNLNAERRMKAELTAFNKEKRDATLADDKQKLEKLKKKELQMRQEQLKVQSARLKVSALTIVPLLAVYWLMASFLGGYNVVVAYAPFALWPIVNSDQTMVLFWWYMLSSFTFSTMLSKLLHTTT